MSPFLLLIALGVRLTSHGPVFYRQERVGWKFKIFRIYKFRTMVVDADRKGPLLSREKDPRVTSIGKYLRRFKLDELPQLFNVLKGEMSLVGPRPEVPYYVEMFKKEYEEILAVRPGITDYASLQYRNESALMDGEEDLETFYVERLLPEKIALAKEYCEKMSFTTDLAIILKTMIAIIKHA